MTSTLAIVHAFSRASLRAGADMRAPRVAVVVKAQAIVLPPPSPGPGRP